MINEKWLLTFMTLAETGHFTLTAEKLNMTQPGVSQHIQKLEMQLKTQLLIRFGKQFEMSLAGQKLYQYGINNAHLQRQLQQNLEFDDPHSGECRFACSGALAMFLYPQFISFQTLHSNLTVALEAAPNKNIIKDLLDDKVDIGIVTQQLDSEQLQQLEIGNELLQLVLPATFKEQTVDAALLRRLGFINHPDGFHFFNKINHTNHLLDGKKATSIPIRGYINQLNQILLPVAQGIGFTVLPERAVKQFQQQQSLHIVPLANPVAEPLFLTKKRHRPLPVRYEWFEKKIITLLTDPDIQ
ncbi:MAG: DNA-binding transcriptional LysR family regulator [Psychromonas sp.]|jgi:DNA-binding transcriptional LysR family regulator|uniref:LysR family transcriptional regulator n=1 Tax=Psychromonas sp. TaxID=1884585 RepID=UPI0039E2AC0D